jgi:CubicO group peptidase (beta-lactamase class C family)
MNKSRPTVWLACLLGAFGTLPAQEVKSPPVESSWLAHGFTAAQREEIRTAFRMGIEKKFIPGGALLIVHKGEPVFREAFGLADLETKRPFTVADPCRIASLTKPHTSTLLALLVEQGKLAWDDPVDKYLPYFAGVTVRGKGPATRSPRIRELLSHTAGFPGQPAIDSGKWKIKTDGTIADTVEDLPRQGLATEPGSVFAYTGLGYMVAGRIAEIITGREFGALMSEKLLAPIGAATATFFPSAELQAKMPIPYDRGSGEFVKIDVVKRAEIAGNFPNPAGRLISTLDDVGKFLSLHRNRGIAGGQRLLAAESLKALYRAQPATGPNGYGLGFNVLKVDADGVGVRIRHTGASGTFAQLDFENDFYFVILTQVPQTQTQPFRDRLLRAINSVFAPESAAKGAGKK